MADRKAERHGEVVGYDIPVKKRDPEEAGDQGNLIISPVVYAELVAAPNRDEGFVDGFLQDTRVDVL